MTPMIEVRNVGKSYQLGQQRTNSLRELLAGFIGKRRPPAEPFWALDDVSFAIQPGEAVGIIGRNGAGKSTLLKLLSRITAPTRGELVLRGRLAALLEVGTGFHSELSGRENIFLNGAIMGMTQREIRAAFDEIVAFAEVDKFLDTPVKRYSSGMYVRLAFAVAAHLRPDILVVDEVLAVGDAAFQKKCLGKMQDVGTSGRTVLFVSHNMAAVTRLCSRAILLKEGKIALDGPVDAAVSAYLRGIEGDSPVSVDYEGSRRMPGTEYVRLLAARVKAEEMRAAVVDIRQPVHVEIDYQILKEHYPLHAYIQVHYEDGTIVFASNDSFDPSTRAVRREGRYRAAIEIPGNFLAEGMYSIGVAVSSFRPPQAHFFEQGVLSFQVHDPGQGDSSRGTYAGNVPGVVRPMFRWSTETLSHEKKIEVA